MSRPDAGWDIEAASLGFYDTDGFLNVQIASEGSESVDGAAPKGGNHGHEVLSPAGLLHRPLDAVLDPSGNVDPAQASQALCYREGGHVVVIPSSDPRVIPNLPTCNGGDTLVYSSCGAFIRINGPVTNPGRISMWTTDTGTALTGNTVALRCWPDRHQRAAPWGTETFDVTGYHLALTSGPCLDMGGMGGPAVPPGYGSYAQLRADSVKLDAKTVQLGPAGVYVPVVLATPLELQVAAIVSAIVELAGGLTAFTGAVTAAAAVASAAVATEPALVAALNAISAVGQGPVASALADVVSRATAITTANSAIHPLCAKSTSAT